jgi:hypothetical protein
MGWALGVNRHSAGKGEDPHLVLIHRLTNAAGMPLANRTTPAMGVRAPWCCHGWTPSASGLASCGIRANVQQNPPLLGLCGCFPRGRGRAAGVDAYAGSMESSMRLPQGS